jgi:hypothetical protein
MVFQIKMRQATATIRRNISANSLDRPADYNLWGRSRICTFPPVMRRVSPGRTLRPLRMDGLTDDELLADAIAYVALDVLHRLARDADARRAFLEGFLRLSEAHGAGAGMPPVTKGGPPIAYMALTRNPWARKPACAGLITY